MTGLLVFQETFSFFWGLTFGGPPRVAPRAVHTARRLQTLVWFPRRHPRALQTVLSVNNVGPGGLPVREVFFFSIFKLYCCSSTVVRLPPPTSLLHPSHPHLPPLIPPHLVFVHVSFIVVPENPSPSPPQLFPPTSPLVTVSLYLISMFLVIFCLLVCSVD